MSKFVDKVAKVLGFSVAEDELDEFDDYDDYGYDDMDDYDDYEEEPFHRSGARITGIGSASRDTGSLRSSAPSRDTGSFRSPAPSRSFSRQTPPSRNNKVVNLHANVQMEVIVASPESFDEARDIADHIKLKKPVIINLEFVQHSTAQRVTDFLCGCCCAMNGNIQRIADKIFMIAPDNIDFAGDVDIRETLEQEGGLNIPWGQD